jgi:hypothetical protein
LKLVVANPVAQGHSKYAPAPPPKFNCIQTLRFAMIFSLNTSLYHILYHTLTIFNIVTLLIQCVKDAIISKNYKNNIVNIILTFHNGPA